MAGAAATLEMQLLMDVAKLQSQMREVKRAVGDMTGDVGRNLGAANDNMNKFAANTTRLSGGAKLAGYQMQNLAYQFQDLGLQMAQAAGSSNPLKMAFMALLQQGSQIQGVLSQAGVGFGGMVKQLVVAHPLLTAAAAAAGLVAAAIELMTLEINKSSKVHVTWKDTALGAYDAIKAYLTGELTSAFKAFGVSTEDVWGRVLNAAKWVINWLIGATSLVPRTLIASWSTIPAAVADIFYSTVNGAIGFINRLIRATVDGLNAFIAAANSVLKYGGITLPTITAPQIAEVKNDYAGAGAKFGQVLAQTVKDSFSRDFLGEFGSYLRPFAEKRARERMAEDAKKAGKEAGKGAADKFAEEWAKMLERLQESVDSAFAAMGKSIVASYNTMATDAWKTLQSDLAANKDARTKPIRDAAEAQAEWNAQLDGTLQRLEQLGGVGNDIARVFKALTGQGGTLGGPLGTLLGTLSGLQWSTIDPKTGDRTIHLLGDEIARIFTKDGAFGRTMKDLLQGSGTGVAIGSVLFGQNNQGAQIGGAIGGAIGQVAGEALGKTIGGTLGKLAGPLGSVLGGVLGSVVGSLFSSKPRGSGVVTNTSVTSSANNDSIKAGLDSFGLGLQTAVSAIADQLGGKVGKYSVGIGRYKDYYQVADIANDPLLGHSHYARDSSHDVYDGLDSQAALRAAIETAIKQGAITGVRAGTQALLKSGTDIEAQLKKALQFEGVFNDLKAATDPVGYQLDQVTKQFATLKDVFKEAGATAADYADLEKLLAIKRADALQQARQELVSKVSDPLNMQIEILKLLGEGERAVAAQRVLELAGLKDTLQPMQALIYQLTDWQAVIDKFAPLADSLKSYRSTLLGGDAGGSFGYLAAAFRSTAALAAGGDATALGALQSKAADYLAAAKDNAASAMDYQRAVSEVLASVDKGIFAAESQADYAQAQIDAIKANSTIIADMKAELGTLAGQLVTSNGQILRLWQRVSADGFDNPLPVTVTS